MFTAKPKSYRIGLNPSKVTKPLNKKLADFIDRNGLRRSWVANKLKMSSPLLSQICTQKINIPKKYWRTIAEFTNGEISVTDLLNEALELKEKDYKGYTKDENLMAR